MSHPLHTITDFVSRPLVGVSTSLGSVIASLLPHLETSMRLGVLFLGLVAGILTVRKSWKDRHK
jgi:F0F1-type ATP synthase assembly protein I